MIATVTLLAVALAAGALLATLRQRVGRLNRHLPAKVVFYWRYNRRYLLTGRAAKS